MTTNRERADQLEAVLRAIVDGDQDTLTGLLADDVRVWTPEASASSVAELLGMIDRRDEAFTDVSLEVVPLDVDGDFACAEWTVELEHTGAIEFPDGTTREPTGRTIVLHGVTVAEFENDRICSLRQYWDRFSLMSQLDAAP